MMKIALFYLFCLLAVKLSARQLHDGPYVLYRENQILVKSVEQGAATEEAFNLKDKKGVEISVKFPGHKNWDFRLNLSVYLKNEPSEFKQPDKLFFVSDVEGEFEGFRALLLANKVIDEKYNWTFGKGHLVLCGDLFDRGSQVPECLWLLYKLETLAKKAGGYVHVILGNHDIMNLSGDLRYVQHKYIESAKVMGVDYMSLYDQDTELGKWLRTKNTIERIGDNLCAHAGIAPQINQLKMSLSEINKKCRPYYDKAKVLKGVGDTTIPVFFKGATSLFWYRGYFKEPKATELEVNETLKLYEVKRIVVGHTIVPGNVGFYYGGKVLGLDVNQHRNDHQAALFENERWWKVDEKGNKNELEIEPPKY
ncbi:metallophosphoesterase [Pedobacter heparinus]|uniref:metallophosphoesterase n=1 Tax=Pedobacter heparinus TaxID=984 RepID=UPI00292F09ED|nr:metallophosphoesterase [Pedobacter heparinus]